MPSENSLDKTRSVRKTPVTFLAPLWPRFIELWIAGVLITFFVIRILGSQTAVVLLNRLAGHPLP